MCIRDRLSPCLTTLKKKEEEFSTIEFKASRGWFDRFKRHSNLHSLRLQGESASANMEAGDKYPSTFKDLVNSRSYPPNLVFNVDETGPVSYTHLDVYKRQALLIQSGL